MIWIITVMVYSGPFSGAANWERAMKQSLQDLLDAAGNTVAHMRNVQTGPYIFPAVPTEFSNWRDEQRAWTKDAVLFDQTHHMTTLTIEGPDALRLVSELGVNSFSGFAKDAAKQLVCCTPDGHYIGDGILFFLEEEQLHYVGRPTVINWLQYNAEKNRYDVSFERQARSDPHAMGRAIERRWYRYQIQGPKARDVIEKLTGQEFPTIGFFRMGKIKIGSKEVRVLRHGMAGTPGLEMWGPYEERFEVRDAILKAGEEFGLVPVGARTYPSSTVESAWIPNPLPAIYTGEALADYRRWLPAEGYEGVASLAGSFVSDKIEDYYVYPQEVGYGHLVKFDHDFVGREALERLDVNALRRRVTFEWNADDVAKIFRSMFDPGSETYKYIDLPNAIYGSHDYDKVSKGGDPAGLSLWPSYSANFSRMLSLGTVPPSVKDGDEVVITWGEEDGGTKKPTVEQHVQCEVRATVAPAPYSQAFSEVYKA